MKLLYPTRLGALRLPNRVVMAPMTRNRAPGTVPGPLQALYYAQRAAAGLLITEATQVHARAQGYPETPGLHNDAQIEGWRGVTRAVHAAGGRIFTQLWHVGRISHPSFHDGDLPVAPSALRPEGKAMTYDGPQPYVTPRALETHEVAEVVAQFREAAQNARAAGFDGIEIHAANGYLIAQFLESGSNRRTDRYGGSVENRARFLLEIVEAAVDVWGSGRVGVRLSPGGTFNDMHDDDPGRTYTYVADALNRYDLAYVHVVHAPGDGTLTAPDGRSVTAPALVRAAYHGTLLVAGGYERDTAEAALQAGEADLVAFARPYLANPDLVTRFALDAPLNTPDRSTFYGGDEAGYTDYPTLVEAPEMAAEAA